MTQQLGQFSTSVPTHWHSKQLSCPPYKLSQRKQAFIKSFRTQQRISYLKAQSQHFLEETSAEKALKSGKEAINKSIQSLEQLKQDTGQQQNVQVEKRPLELVEKLKQNIDTQQRQQLQENLQQQNIKAKKVEEKVKNKKRQQLSYQLSAVMSSSLVSFVAFGATFYRYFYHTHDQGIDYAQIAGTVGIVFGWVVTMEYIARFLHKHLWHDFEPGAALHQSHHEPRTGPFEANDLYALMFAVPAMQMCYHGFVTPGWLGTIMYASGLGITIYGNMYMFIHDGMVHKRFPVGPIEQNKYLQRVATAHRMHHQDKFKGVPFGLFLGPQELEEIGAKDELEQQLQSFQKHQQRHSQQQQQAQLQDEGKK